jgi:hypothetical protein
MGALPLQPVADPSFGVSAGMTTGSVLNAPSKFLRSNSNSEALLFLLFGFQQLVVLFEE